MRLLIAIVALLFTINSYASAATIAVIQNAQKRRDLAAQELQKNTAIMADGWITCDGCDGNGCSVEIGNGWKVTERKKYSYRSYLENYGPANSTFQGISPTYTPSSHCIVRIFYSLK